MSPMANITEHVDELRSKNAGPYEVALDVIFTERETYERVKREGIIDRERIATLYDIPVSDVRVFLYYDAAKAIKATLRRPVPSGSMGDGDVYGAQQYAPLLDIEIPAAASEDE